MKIDFREGMKCLSCGKQNHFGTIHFGTYVTLANYCCICGFAAQLAIPERGYSIEYRAVKDDEG